MGCFQSSEKKKGTKVPQAAQPIPAPRGPFQDNQFEWNNQPASSNRRLTEAAPHIILPRPSADVTESAEENEKAQQAPAEVGILHFNSAVRITVHLFVGT